MPKDVTCKGLMRVGGFFCFTEVRIGIVTARFSDLEALLQVISQYNH